MTDRRRERTERLLRRLEAAQQRARIGTFEYDVVKKTSLWSRVMYELHGVDPSSPAPTYIEDYAAFIHPDDVEPLRLASARAQAGEDVVEVEVRAKKGDGWVNLRVLLHVDRDENGLLRFMSGSMQDITADVDLREELIRDREAARDEARAKTQFLARVTHELRTPLGGVIGMIDLALGDQDAATRADHLASARASARHLLELIDDLLDASREDHWIINVVEIEFDLRQVLHQAIAMVAPRAQRKGLELSGTFEPDLLPLRLGDPLRLRQVLVNLLYNAVKFTPSGQVTARVVAGDGRDAVEMIVQDTGVGIAKAEQERVFEPFVQDQASAKRAGERGEGVGLGLAITKELVEAMGGTIELSSTVGVGTCFVVRLNLQPGQRGETSDRLRTIDTSSNSSITFRNAPTGMRVLVAEDHPTNAAIAQAVLERAGHRPHWVADGESAVNAVSAERFDVVLMDLEMPGLDGPGAARRIRAAEHAAGSPRLPIIALSAHKDAELAAAASGMDAYMRKPLDADTLDAMMRRVASGELRGPIDHDLRMSRVGGRAELARTVAGTFLNHAPTLLEPIDHALEHGDPEELHRAAHGLRAALLMVGAVRAGELAAVIERAPLAEATRLRDGLAADVARTTAELALLAGR
ncbi:MAG TPA: ATP-binding protein [Kofleriaceae bacterium]|nr:ATP-binding protein [Kofleriaceae bacterium]